MGKRTDAEDIKAYFAGYERAPLTDDEVSMLRWNEAHFCEVLDEPSAATKRRRNRRRS